MQVRILSPMTRVIDMNITCSVTISALCMYGRVELIPICMKGRTIVMLLCLIIEDVLKKDKVKNTRNGRLYK